MGIWDYLMFNLHYIKLSGNQTEKEIQIHNLETDRPHIVEADSELCGLTGLYEGNDPICR
jgi:hypothetical protein